MSIKYASCICAMLVSISDMPVLLYAEMTWKNQNLQKSVRDRGSTLHREYRADRWRSQLTKWCPARGAPVHQRRSCGTFSRPR